MVAGEGPSASWPGQDARGGVGPDAEVLCTRCGTPAEGPLAWRCACGGPLRVEVRRAFDRGAIVATETGLWRYRHAFPGLDRLSAVSLGETTTPVVALDAADGRGGPSLRAKLDFLLPTGSFKDRGSAIMMSAVAPALREAGSRSISEDSSGNAGASLAAYAARAGFACSVFVPEAASAGKLRQIRAYGASVREVPGSRQDVALAAQKAQGCWYAGHAWNPFFTDGMRSAAYEIAEQTGWEPPDEIVVPVSAGTLLLGLVAGLRHLHESGAIPRLPSVTAVQAARNAPVYHRFHDLPYKPPERVTTIADVLVSTAPPRLDEMVAALRSVRGNCEVAEEEEIVAARERLGRRGILTEPSSATVEAVVHRRGTMTDPDRRTLLILTGSGLKA